MKTVQVHLIIGTTLVWHVIDIDEKNYGLCYKNFKFRDFHEFSLYSAETIITQISVI